MLLAGLNSDLDRGLAHHLGCRGGQLGISVKWVLLNKDMESRGVGITYVVKMEGINGEKFD